MKNSKTVKRFLLCLSLLFSLLLPFETQLYAQDNSEATLAVNVVNGTSDGADVAGDLVVVTIYNNGRSAGNLEGKVGPDGSAVFESVPSGAGVAAVAIAQHGDMTFGSRMFQLGGGQKAFAAKIDVYEVSTEASKITVGIHHLIIKPQEDSVVITEYMLLNNPTDRAISSLDKDEQVKTKVVQIHLPKGFRDLTFEDYFEADAVVVTDDGFYDVMAMPPGEHAAEFSYALDITSEIMEITKKFSMPAAELMVFSMLAPGSIQGLGEPAGQMQIGDRMAEYFVPVGAETAGEITFQAGGFGARKPRKITLFVIVLVFAHAAGACLVAVRVRRKKKQQ